jgi:hypothetical protein
LNVNEKYYVLENIKTSLLANIEICNWLSIECFKHGLSMDYKINPNPKNQWDLLIEFTIGNNETLITPDNYKYVDGVSTVYCLEVPSHIIYVRRNGKACWCSQSSRHGNKGIVSLKVPREDMPYSEDGIIPDLIISPQSVPTRMAVNQLIETYLSILCAQKGCMYDATCFKKLDIDGITEEFKKYGIKDGGTKRMFNGKTGCWFDTKIFIGPTTYQRISKFVTDDRYAMRTGPVNTLTRQPVDGKNSAGGMKIGEMEKDCIVGHGAMRAFYEKWYDDSDGVNIQVCRVCSNRAVANEDMSKYICKNCGFNADICSVKSSWTSNLFLNYIEGMGIKLKLKLDPFAYQENEK